ncbi:MAG: hypothetical protein E3J82_01160 [Candidatus Thorarchaeota archaeon]|nr:MAG: hypothetical protein E3J82_01160 [Candidatus Thorarchaeota archaeon]
MGVAVVLLSRVVPGLRNHVVLSTISSVAVTALLIMLTMTLKHTLRRILLRIENPNILEEAYENAISNLSTSYLPMWQDWFTPAFQEHLSIQVAGMLKAETRLDYCRVFLFDQNRSSLERTLKEDQGARSCARALDRIHSRFDMKTALLTIGDIREIVKSLCPVSRKALGFTDADLRNDKAFRKTFRANGAKLDFASIRRANGDCLVYGADIKEEDPKDPRLRYHEIARALESKAANPEFGIYDDLERAIRKVVYEPDGSSMKKEYSLTKFLRDLQE